MSEVHGGYTGTFGSEYREEGTTTTYYSVASAIDSNGADGVVAYFVTGVVRSR